MPDHEAGQESPSGNAGRNGNASHARYGLALQSPAAGIIHGSHGHGDPIYQREDPYFGGQQVDRLLIELAKEIPERYVTPATALAYSSLSKVIVDGAEFVENRRGNHEQLVAQCRVWLAEIARDIERRIEHSRFEEKREASSE